LATTALIEEHDAIARGIEEAAHLRLGPAAGAAVHEEGRLPLRVPRLLPVDLVDVSDLQAPRPVRRDLGVELAALHVVSDHVARGAAWTGACPACARAVRRCVPRAVHGSTADRSRRPSSPPCVAP